MEAQIAKQMENAMENAHIQDFCLVYNIEKHLWQGKR